MVFMQSAHYTCLISTILGTTLQQLVEVFMSDFKILCPAVQMLISGYRQIVGHDFLISCFLLLAEKCIILEKLIEMDIYAFVQPE
jgi:hypothetical protein